MATGGGTLMVLGTTVVAALAVGVAVGVHTLVGDPTAEPSSSDSTPPSPSPTVSTGGDFCGLMVEMMDLGQDGAAPLASNPDVFGDETGDEATLLASIHAWGLYLSESQGPLAAIERDAAAIVEDPTIAEALEDSAAMFDLYGEIFAALALDAGSSDAFFTQISSVSEDPEGDAIGVAGDKANRAISIYVADECGIFLTGVDPAISAAKHDAATLGMILAVFFMGWNEGDPLPVVTIVDGFYYIQDTQMDEVSPGIALVDQSATGWDDWCVSVSYEGRADATYRYSMTDGMAEGTCAALTGA